MSRFSIILVPLPHLTYTTSSNLTLAQPQLIDIPNQRLLTPTLENPNEPNKIEKPNKRSGGVEKKR